MPGAVDGGHARGARRLSPVCAWRAVSRPSSSCGRGSSFEGVRAGGLTGRADRIGLARPAPRCRGSALGSDCPIMPMCTAWRQRARQCLRILLLRPCAARLGAAQLLLRRCCISALDRLLDVARGVLDAGLQLLQLGELHLAVDVGLDLARRSAASGRAKCPAVRATRGSRSGPMTTSATTPMTISSREADIEHARACSQAPRGAKAQVLALSLTSPSMVWPAPGAGAWRSACSSSSSSSVLHAFLEALDGAAEVGAEVAQLLGAEDQHAPPPERSANARC